MVWYGMVWYGLVWFGLVWYGLVWFGMVWYGYIILLKDIKKGSHNQLPLTILSLNLLD
jgi:hypothetical protein